MKLPLNTTKRGLDTSSDVYHIVLEYMQTGMKKFTSFTNDWKMYEDQTEKEFRSLKSLNPTELTITIEPSKLKSIRKHKDKGTGKHYTPDLPKPQKKQNQKRVCFNASQKEIELVAEYYYDDLRTERSTVGRRCFDESLEWAREATE